MSMFCYQCQETVKNEKCTVKGVCGKEDDVANLQDLLVYLLKGVSFYSTKAREKGIVDKEVDEFVMESLFATITNVNFNAEDFVERINKAIDLRERMKNKIDTDEVNEDIPEMVTWTPADEREIYEKAQEIGVLDTENEDVRSLRELLTYGLKGMAAYIDHAYVLEKEDEDIPVFMQEALAATTDDSLSIEELINYVMKCGELGVKSMALLDEANTEAYGHPEPTEIELGARDNPAILVSGHDLRDLEDLLEQTKNTGIDVYTHGEMLPAHTYPVFKKYDHFVGNYGNSWWKQKEEFQKFNGPVLMTTNCLIPPQDSYKDRVYTTGVVGFEGVTHIPNRENGEPKDFSEIIEQAKKCNSPQELETGQISGGFAHESVLNVSDKVVEAVKEGKIKEFFVMAGCDGRQKNREYYTEFARNLPENTVILTAGCAKYRYNKLDLGDIDGIPRVIDAGQCNDSYSLIVIAQKLAEAFELDDINDLPISYNIAWYEQKSVLILLALLYLGVEDIKLGPTLPAFVSENVLNVLVDKFNIQPNTEVEKDMEEMLA